MFSLEFLGSGTSTGVPAIGCECAVCASSDPRNKRLRPSVLLRCGGFTLVVDTGPDFRTQMLRAKVKRVDAFLLTHFHADHFTGIDDVRRFNSMQKTVLDYWATGETLANLRRSFPYVFSETLRPGLPCIRGREISMDEDFEIGPLHFQPLLLDHQVMSTLGLLVSEASASTNAPRLAYLMDCKRVPAEAGAAARGADTLVLDMLREQPHPTHLSLKEALDVIALIQPKRTWFAHMAHEVDHAACEAKLPPEIRLAYDGLVVEVG